MESTYDHRECEVNVIAAIHTNPCVQLMLLALEASGCPVKLRRHVSCEPCAGTLKGEMRVMTFFWKVSLNSP